MKYLLLLPLLTTISFVNGQPDMFSSLNADNSPTLEVYDITGKRVPTGSNTSPEGNRMLNENYRKGIVKLTNGQLYKDVLLNLSLVTNELYFKKDSVELAFINPVETFALPVKVKDTVKMALFKNGYPGTDNQTMKTFYQVLSVGPKIELLKYSYKVAREHYAYGGPVQKEYVLENRLYIYDLGSGKLEKIMANVKSLNKSLPVYKNDINTFASENHIQFRREEEIISVIDIINKKTEE